jgi:hypothetical protein
MRSERISPRFFQIAVRPSHFVACPAELLRISDALPFGRLWYDGPNATSNAISYAKFFSRSYDALVRVYDAAGKVIQTHAHAGGFKDW